MRCLIGLCLFALAMPVLAIDSEEPDLATAPPTSWEGKHSNQLIAAWGKPRRTKRDGNGRKVLVYRLRIYGGPVLDVNQPDGRADPACGVGFMAGLAIIATQEAKFYLDRGGVVQREEIAPMTWK